ncbi:MAG: M23 family metallopeptidase [Lachnospiraceae bacterium]|nr:M23 family metallopeptidase [Lachnospiraceae bacterium]
MKNNSKNSFFKEKSFLALTLVAVFALAGVIAVASVINNSQSGKTPYVDLNESGNEDSTQGTTGNRVADNQRETTTPVDAENPTEETTQVAELPTESDYPVDVAPIALMFSSEDTLTWPVEGNVVLEYSMDGSIYFPTLEQYKYNPAMLVQSEVNTPVEAAADCVVKEIGSNEEIGTYVVMSLGGDYELTYGQLKSLEVSEGDTIREGEVIGYVNEPTKYYLVEGCNLYIKLTQGGEPVDPLDYIR